MRGALVLGASLVPALVVQTLSDDFGAALWTLGLIALVALGLDYWRTYGTVLGLRFPQLVDEPPNLVVDLAQPVDRMAPADRGQWLHLTVKNRKKNGRRTRTAHNALIRTVVDGGTPFHPQLFWAMENGPAQKRRNVDADDRVFIPLLIKGDADPNKPLWAQDPWTPAYGTTMKRAFAHITEEQWYQQVPGTPLAFGGHFNVDVRVEYDGGRVSSPAHFAIQLPKEFWRRATVERADA